MIEIENIKEFRWVDSFCGYTYANTNYTDIQLNHTYPYYILGDDAVDTDYITDLNDKNYNGELF